MSDYSFPAAHEMAAAASAKPEQREQDRLLLALAAKIRGAYGGERRMISESVDHGGPRRRDEAPMGMDEATKIAEPVLAHFRAAGYTATLVDQGVGFRGGSKPAIVVSW